MHAQQDILCRINEANRAAADTSSHQMICNQRCRHVQLLRARSHASSRSHSIAPQNAAHITTHTTPRHLPLAEPKQAQVSLTTHAVMHACSQEQGQVHQRPPQHGTACCWPTQSAHTHDTTLHTPPTSTSSLKSPHAHTQTLKKTTNLPLDLQQRAHSLGCPAQGTCQALHVECTRLGWYSSGAL